MSRSIWSSSGAHVQGRGDSIWRADACGISAHTHTHAQHLGSRAVSSEVMVSRLAGYALPRSARVGIMMVACACTTLPIGRHPWLSLKGVSKKGIITPQQPAPRAYRAAPTQGSGSVRAHPDNILALSQSRSLQRNGQGGRRGGSKGEYSYWLQLPTSAGGGRDVERGTAAVAAVHTSSRGRRSPSPPPAGRVAFVRRACCWWCAVGGHARRGQCVECGRLRRPAKQTLRRRGRQGGPLLVSCNSIMLL